MYVITMLVSHYGTAEFVKWRDNSHLRPYAAAFTHKDGHAARLMLRLMLLRLLLPLCMHVLLCTSLCAPVCAFVSVWVVDRMCTCM